MADTVILNLDDLSADIPALTDSLALRMQEAVVMCMETHGHSSGVLCELRNLHEVLAELRTKWRMSYSDPIRRSFGDSRNAAERAGEAIAILTVIAVEDYSVVECARIGDGFDFWLSPANDDDDDDYLFQDAMGLESKGLSHARFPSDITGAIKDGIAQIVNSKNAEVPALVVATEFSRPVIYMVHYEP